MFVAIRANALRVAAQTLSLDLARADGLPLA